MENDDPFILFFDDSGAVVSIESVATLKSAYNIAAETWEEVAQAYIEIVTPDPERIYDALTQKYIHQVYSLDDEFSRTNFAIMDMAQGLPFSQQYIDYRAYVEDCKDRAYMEVFGVERPRPV
jgi:hypothetical protein